MNCKFSIRHGLKALPLILLSVAGQAAALGDGAVKTIYKKQCASCHGANLEGAMASSLLDDKWVKGGSDKQLMTSIKHGVAGTSMPPWQGKLSDDEIRTLVLLIREQAYLAKTNKAVKAGSDGSYQSKHHAFSTQAVLEAKGLIWAMDFLPDNTLIYTLRKGELWTQSPQGNKQQVKNTPTVWHRGQGGLLDVYPDPDYRNNGWVYLSYSKKTGVNDASRDIGITSIVRGKIENNTWVKEQTLYEAPVEKHKNRGWHFGSRFAVKGDYLFFTNGDEGYQDSAQDVKQQSGKVHRIFKDGRVPTDNPFYNVNNAEKTIWTYGNRNPQGLTIEPKTGDLYSTEHGPRGGDELNLITKGTNYGWPKATFGMNYDGTPITPHTDLPGMQLPVHQWTPSIAVSGINFYTGTTFNKWQGDLFVGSLAFKELHRLRIKDKKVVEDEIILKGLGRIRDVITAPNGNLYVSVNDKGAGISKVVMLVK